MNLSQRSIYAVCLHTVSDLNGTMSDSTNELGCCFYDKVYSRSISLLYQWFSNNGILGWLMATI